jgi:integrase
MEALPFIVRLKSGDSPEAYVHLITYNKAFSRHRFVWSTGLKVKRKGFDPERLGKAIKNLKAIAEQASVDIRTEGQPLTKETLSQRIELMVNRVNWNKSELSIWSNGKAESFKIPEGVDQKALNDSIGQELLKMKPNLKGVVSNVLNEGTSELFGFWQAVVDGKIKARRGKKLRPITITNKKQTLKLVKEYNPRLTFADMDMKFFNGFTSWMAEPTKEREKGLDPNSIGKHIKELKSILHLASKNDIAVNDKFIYWPVTREANEVVTLTKDEVLQLLEVDLTGTKRDVRDIFIMACFLGLRIGDFPNLVKENFFTENGVEFFGDVQGKTSARVKIPVFPQVRKLLKDRGDFPKMIAEQNFRTYLKEICKSAKLNDRVVIKIREGKPEYKIKWQALSPHSARRTFASGLYYGWWGKPLPAALCMRYTGHKSEKSFMRYIGASEADLDAKALEYFDLKPKMEVA